MTLIAWHLGAGIETTVYIFDVLEGDVSDGELEGDIDTELEGSIEVLVSTPGGGD
jgi:hypothetical protein